MVKSKPEWPEAEQRCKSCGDKPVIAAMYDRWLCSTCFDREFEKYRAMEKGINEAERTDE